MSSLNDSAERFKKSLQRSQSGPEIKRKATGTIQNTSEGKRAQSPGATVSTEERLLNLRKEVQSLGSDVHPNSLVRFLIRLLEICQSVNVDNVANILKSDLFSESSIVNAIRDHPSITLTPNNELILKKSEPEYTFSAETLQNEILAKSEDRALSYSRKIGTISDHLLELNEKNLVFMYSGRDDDIHVVFSNDMSSIPQASPDLCQIWHSHTSNTSKAEIYDKLKKLGIRPSTSYFQASSQEIDQAQSKRAKTRAKRSSRVKMTNIHLNLF